ncbi:MAG: hypothetical protein JMHAAFGB_00620 [Dehalococcoides mccartyi]|nr:hypothetical protein [Dehalococcoides mccartyi]
MGGFTDTLFNCRNKVAGYRAAYHRIYKLNPAARLYFDNHMPVLAMAAALFFMFVIRTGCTQYSLTVRHAGSSQINRHPKLASHPLRHYFQLGLTQTGGNSLTGIRITMHMQGQIFFAEPGQSIAQFIHVSLALGENSHLVAG